MGPMLQRRGCAALRLQLARDWHQQRRMCSREELTAHNNRLSVEPKDGTDRTWSCRCRLRNSHGQSSLKKTYKNP